MTSAQQYRAAYFVHDRKFELAECTLSAPAADDVTVDIAYCGICGTDLHIFHGAMPHRLGDRRVLGHEVSGIVSATGDQVNSVRVGDPVAIRPLAPCNNCPACKSGHSHICHNLAFLGIDTDGGFAEKWTVPANTIHKLPASLSLREAALVEPLAVACHNVERGQVKPGEDVLVIGGGPIGLLVAMAARAAGGKVTVSEINPGRLAVIQSIGFDTIDPANQDVAGTINDITGSKGADVVFEVSGSQAGVDCMTEVAAVRGRIVMVAIHPEPPKIDLFRFFWRELELFGARVYEPQNYDQAISLLESGDIATDTMITDEAPLSDIQKAFDALEGSTTAMKSLITINPG